MSESAMSSAALNKTVLTKEEVNERIDVGIAFLVLLLMGALGAYLMTAEDPPASFDVVDTAVVGSANEADVFSAPTEPRGSSVNTRTTTDADERDLRREAQAALRAQQRASTSGVANASVPVMAASQTLDQTAETLETAATETIEAAVPTTGALIERTEAVFEPIREEVMGLGGAVLEEAASVEAAVDEPVAEALELTESVAQTSPEQAEGAKASVVPVEERSALAEPAVISKRESAVLRSATQNVSFVTGSAQLTQASRLILDDIAALLKSRPATRLSVIGFTDAQGDPDENVALSFSRAEACRDYLLQQGVGVGQVDSAGMGARRPIGDNATPEGRRQNRRVEFTLLRGGS